MKISKVKTKSVDLGRRVKKLRVEFEDAEIEEISKGIMFSFPEKGTRDYMSLYMIGVGEGDIKMFLEGALALARDYGVLNIPDRVSTGQISEEEKEKEGENR